MIIIQRCNDRQGTALYWLRYTAINVCNSVMITVHKNIGLDDVRMYFQKDTQSVRHRGAV